MILGRTVHLIWIMVMIGRILMISIMVRLNSSGPKGSSGALLIRTLVFGLSGGILTIIIMMVIMVIFTLCIVVMIIVFFCFDHDHCDDVRCFHGAFAGQEFSLSESDLYNMI